MFGERNKHSDSFLKVQIAVNVLLVQLLHNKLLQFWTGYVLGSEGEEDAADRGGLLSIECLDPLNSNRGNDSMERLVDWQAV